MPLARAEDQATIRIDGFHRKAPTAPDRNLVARLQPLKLGKDAVRTRTIQETKQPIVK
jgi:hypothetical protein